MSCLLAGAVALTLSGDAFSLSWTHSVERVEWREDWRIEGNALRLTRAAIKGSGAGMEPGENAVLQDGWWIWSPDLPPQPQLLLAASGLTPSAWQICDGDACQQIGADPGAAIALKPCPAE